jgi:hypothetical protein
VKIADTLLANGRLSQTCEGRIYSTCLWFGLDGEEQERTRFRYEYSNFQVECSRKLLFEIGGQIEEVFQAPIDRGRVRLDEDHPDDSGLQASNQVPEAKGRSAEWEVAVERPTYALTIFKLQAAD